MENRYQEAIDNLQKADNLMEGEYAWAKAYKGVAHALKGDYAPAFAEMGLAIIEDNRVLEQAFEPGESRSDVNYALGVTDLFINQKQYDYALVYCQLALVDLTKGEGVGKLSRVRALVYLAEIRIAMKHLHADKAIRDAHQALDEVEAEVEAEKKPLSRSQNKALRKVSELRSRLHIREGKQKEAEDALNTAFSLSSPRDPKLEARLKQFNIWKDFQPLQEQLKESTNDWSQIWKKVK
ncbi:hypothetical protein HYR99_05440 [Candidatus Poribacteria bacterium]|nr:hypothetical protein [Candidatus Poribacteria bacterium]